MLAFVCLALVAAQAFSAPTPQFPPRYYGTYESDPTSDTNFADFVKPFNLPNFVSVTRPNYLTFRQDGEWYYTRFYFGQGVPTFELKWQPGQVQTTTINGHNVEYVYNFETEGDDTFVLNGKFRDTQSELKFTVTATFKPTGFSAVYAREGVTARRVYTRVPNPTLGGLYENVPERQSPNFVEFASRVMPAPQGLKWDSDTAIWLGRYGRDFVAKYIVTPAVHVKFPFRLGEKRTTTLNGRTVTYTYNIVEENPTTNTIKVRGEFTSEQGTLVGEYTVDPQGITATYTAGDQTASRYYRRALSYLVYGTYENVPTTNDNWSEFATYTGKMDDSNQKTRVQLYRVGPTSYFRLTYENGATHVYPFELNKTYEITTPTGPVKYTFSERPSYTNDVILATNYQWNGKNINVEMTFNATGTYATYRSGTYVARRYYQRVLPAVVFGTYTSQPDVPEFTTFAQAIGSPELTQKTTVDIVPTPTNPEYPYTQTIKVEGVTTPAEFPFTLGRPRTTTLKGKELNYSYYFFEYPTPVLHTYWTEAGNGPTTFTVSAEFTPTGYTAWYVTGGRLATRTYTRVGEPVPLPTYPTA